MPAKADESHEKRYAESDQRNMANDSKNDIKVVAFMHAKPGEEEAVQNAIVECVPPSRVEAGNLSYYAHVAEDDPRLFVVIEHWASAEARDRHLQTDHFKALSRAVDDSEELDQHFFHVLSPL